MSTLNLEIFEIDDFLEEVEKAAWGYFTDTNSYPDTLYASSLLHHRLHSYTRKYTHAKQAFGAPGYSQLMFATSAGQINVVEVSGRDDDFWAVCRKDDIGTGLVEKMLLGDKDGN